MTYKATLKDHSAGGCDFSIIMVGDSILDAIQDYLGRKKEVDIIHSISHPYSQDSYHIEHSGREEDVWDKNAQASIPKKVYCDTIEKIKMIEEEN